VPKFVANDSIRATLTLPSCKWMWHNSSSNRRRAHHYSRCRPRSYISLQSFTYSSAQTKTKKKLSA